MGRIFVIEDDGSLRRELANVLQLDGHEVCECADFARGAEEVLAASPDAVILDLKLPGADGLGICRGIRGSSEVPILVLTSSDAEFDEVMSMKLGADDYLAKPYRPAVLLAHVARLLQRANSAGASRIEFAGIALDMARATASCAGNEIGLTRNEACVLAALIRARGAIVSRQELMRALWETDAFVDDNTLTVNVNRLRRALERAGAPDGVLKTHRGQGYSL
ncbi:MAG: response regulator transcription factor [Eggerthellaceae bacterium]|nr:response regulator transcription factor [Eggerthellaceae bacterium]